VGWAVLWVSQVREQQIVLFIRQSLFGFNFTRSGPDWQGQLTHGSLMSATNGKAAQDFQAARGHQTARCADHLLQAGQERRDVVDQLFVSLATVVY
jgi:hypothetical protein